MERNMRVGLRLARSLLLATLVVLGPTLPGSNVTAQGPAPGQSAASAGCVAGGVYDPACDVNRDDTIDILDIQLTASHWGQAGTWTGDNNHDHLGQTWTGNNNSLLINGTFGSWPDNYAPLVLKNGSGDGVLVPVVGADGVEVTRAGDDGFSVCRTGNRTTCTDRADLHNGVEIGSTEHHGVRIDDAGLDGVAVIGASRDGLHVEAAGDDGLFVCTAGGVASCAPQEATHNGVEIGHSEHDGLFVNGAGRDGVYVAGANRNGLAVGHASNIGLYVQSADYIGVHATGSTLAGYFYGSIQVVGDCINCVLATFAVNTGDTALAPGDVVSLAGLRANGVDNVPVLMEVEAAAGQRAIVGVVQGRAEPVPQYPPRPGETGRLLVPREGTAEPGQYVTVVYSGLAQVRAGAFGGPITQGSKLSVGPGGAARALRTVAVEGVRLTESAPVVGVALEDLKEGEDLIWVLVNPQ